MGSANDGLRFLLELGVLASIGLWAFHAADGAMRWLFAIGAPITVAVLWAVFVNPNGSQALADPARLALEVGIFGAGAAALAALGRERLALLFATVVVVHLALTFPLDQRDPESATAAATQLAASPHGSASHRE
jgi:hypothetical protein